jgi:hypothetical protein
MTVNQADAEREIAEITKACRVVREAAAIATAADSSFVREVTAMALVAEAHALAADAAVYQMRLIDLKWSERPN